MHLNSLSIRNINVAVLKGYYIQIILRYQYILYLTCPTKTEHKISENIIFLIILRSRKIIPMISYINEGPTYLKVLILQRLELLFSLQNEPKILIF